MNVTAQVKTNVMVLHKLITANAGRNAHEFTEQAFKLINDALANIVAAEATGDPVQPAVIDVEVLSTAGFRLMESGALYCDNITFSPELLSAWRSIASTKPVDGSTLIGDGTTATAINVTAISTENAQPDDTTTASTDTKPADTTETPAAGADGATGDAQKS